MAHIKHTPAKGVNKKREKAGSRPISERRDLKLIQLLVLKCVNSQSAIGALKHDILFRCELNHYYANQIIDKLLGIGAIHTVEQDEEANNGTVEKRTRYYLTQKGLEIHNGLAREFEELGYNTDINNPRIKIC